MAAVDRIVVQSLVVEQLSQAIGYTPTPAANMRLYANGIRDMILAVDGEVCLAILSNPAHARRRDFTQSIALADAAQLPSHVGPIGSVRINGKPASLASLDLVRRTRINALLVPVDPYFNVADQRIFHNGTVANFSTATADVDYCSFTQDSSGFLCQAPSEYTAVEVAGTLAIIASVDGDDTPLASLYSGIFNSYLQMVGGGAMVVPDMAQMTPQGQ